MVKKVSVLNCVIVVTMMLSFNVGVFAKTEIIKTFKMKECTSGERVYYINSDRDGKFWLLSMKKKDFSGASGVFADEYGYCLPSYYDGISWKEDSFPETIVNSRVDCGFQKAGNGSLYLLTATAYIDGGGHRFTGGPIFWQTSAGWKKLGEEYSFPLSYSGAILSDSTIIRTKSNSDTIYSYKNNQLVKKVKIDTSTGPVTSTPEVYADEAGGAWVLWDAWHTDVGLYYWNGDSCSLVIQQKRLSFEPNIVKQVHPLPGGGVAVTIDNADFSDTVVFIKNGVIGNKKYAVPTLTHNYFPDALERLWTVDSTKIWVNNGVKSDTLLASSLSMGKIRSAAVSRNASQTALLCDSGVVIFRTDIDPVSVKAPNRYQVNFTCKANLKVQRFSLDGRALTNLKAPHNQIVIERGVDLKISKRLLMRN